MLKHFLNVNTFLSKAFTFDPSTGLSPDVPITKRFLSKMKGMYADDEICNKLIEEENPIVYEFYELGMPEKPTDLAFGTTMLYPGKIGAEYFMTKGHFHEILDTAEVYYCIRGHGYLLMEDPKGNVEFQEFTPGVAIYVPPDFAHRSINVSPHEPLITFFAFRGDAGHDYKTIETKGFRKLMIEQDGVPILIDNPKWK